MKRVKYNKADLQSTIRAAQKVIGNKPLYVFATYNGYTINTLKPPFGQKYIEVKG